MIKDKELGPIARRMMEHLWHKMPQELKDHAMWDVMAFGAVQPSTEARFMAVIDSYFRTEKEEGSTQT